jgi:hypothetical protein
VQVGEVFQRRSNLVEIVSHSKARELSQKIETRIGRIMVEGKKCYDEGLTMKE